MPYPSLYEAQFAARYAARYHERCAKLWHRFAMLITLVELIGGSAAFGAWMAQNAQLGAYMGLALATAAALNHSFKPTENYVGQEQARKDFMALLTDHTADLADFNQRLSQLYMEYGNSFEGLRNPAYNDVAREYGRDDHIAKLHFTEWMLNALC